MEGLEFLASSLSASDVGLGADWGPVYGRMKLPDFPFN